MEVGVGARVGVTDAAGGGDCDSGRLFSNWIPTKTSAPITASAKTASTTVVARIGGRRGGSSLDGEWVLVAAWVLAR
ncbi:MAG: hypothetical protein ACRDUT_12875, partial [Mycobacterium sp.]